MTPRARAPARDPQSLTEYRDAGANVMAQCRACNHRDTVDILKMLGLFQKRGWPDDLATVERRLKCSACGSKRISVSTNYNRGGPGLHPSHNAPLSPKPLNTRP